MVGEEIYLDPMQDPRQFAVARKRMVTEQLLARGIKDEKVLQIMLDLPRHRFVDPGLADQAYSDRPLNIGEGQTISQPYIVALMTEALKIGPEEKILEIGMGCGYQTAILAKLGVQVYSIERIAPLLFRARRLLKGLGYRNIHLKVGDGTLGWPQYAPFDVILVAAASPKIPQSYLSQLAEGGRLILPVGDEISQDLTLVTKIQGRLYQQRLSGCRFVKLKGRHGFAPD